MRLISSRQAWHDCYYSQANSTMDSATEQLKDGVTAKPSSGMSGNWKKTKPGKNDNGSYRDQSGKFMHQALAGKIQFSISCLPEVHRRFGMMMYAPLNFIHIEDVEIPADWILKRVSAWYFDRNKPISNEKLELLPFFIRALLTRHRALVTNQKDIFRKHQYFQEYLFDEMGIKVPASGFTRKYGDLINRVICVIDDLDKECLVPVAKVIREYDDHATILSDLDQKHLWGGVGEMWDLCFVEIRKYCGVLKV